MIFIYMSRVKAESARDEQLREEYQTMSASFARIGGLDGDYERALRSLSAWWLNPNERVD